MSLAASERPGQVSILSSPRKCALGAIKLIGQSSRCGRSRKKPRWQSSVSSHRRKNAFLSCQISRFALRAVPGLRISLSRAQWRQNIPPSLVTCSAMAAEYGRRRTRRGDITVTGALVALTMKRKLPLTARSEHRRFTYAQEMFCLQRRICREEGDTVHTCEVGLSILQPSPSTS
jgi:hypothetical protein